MFRSALRNRCERVLVAMAATPFEVSVRIAGEKKHVNKLIWKNMKNNKTIFSGTKTKNTSQVVRNYNLMVLYGIILDMTIELRS